MENNGKLPHIFIPSKTATLIPEFAVEFLPWAELQPWRLPLQWKTALGQKGNVLASHSADLSSTADWANVVDEIFPGIFLKL